MDLYYCNTQVVSERISCERRSISMIFVCFAFLNLGGAQQHKGYGIVNRSQSQFLVLGIVNERLKTKKGELAGKGLMETAKICTPAQKTKNQ